jgi:hypothetical protein
MSNPRDKYLTDQESARRNAPYRHLIDEDDSAMEEAQPAAPRPAPSQPSNPDKP